MTTAERSNRLTRGKAAYQGAAPPKSEHWYTTPVAVPSREGGCSWVLSTCNNGAVSRLILAASSSRSTVSATKFCASSRRRGFPRLFRVHHWLLQHSSRLHGRARKPPGCNPFCGYNPFCGRSLAIMFGRRQRPERVPWSAPVAGVADWSCPSAQACRRRFRV